MAKLEINKVAETIKRHDVAPETFRAIIEDLNLQAQPEVDEEKAPAIKKQFSVIVSDPNGLLTGNDLVAWVCQIPEDESVTSTLERLHRAAYEFNTTKKGRLMPAKTVGEALEHIPGKHFKEQQVWVKTKVPVLVIRTDNEIPREPAQADDATDSE
jgi:hypothetical protein